MFTVKRLVLNINGKKFKFSRDGKGYFFTEKTDEKKYRDDRETFQIPIDKDKTTVFEEYETNSGVWRIGHVEMRNVAYYAQTATVYYNENGVEKRRILKDQSDIEITVEDGIFFKDDDWYGR